MDTSEGSRGDGSGIQLGYQHTLMYGSYSRAFAEEAKEEAKRLKGIEKQRKKSEKANAKELRAYRGKWISRFDLLFGWFWRNVVARLGEDWIFLAILGIIVAVISFIQDYLILQLNSARLYLFALTSLTALKYLSWISIPVSLVLFSSGFVHLVAPQAIGSGIPEMKTILRGVVLKEYLSFRTLVAKTVGLTATLGAGMPLGKEGPLVHIASIVAALMSRLVTSFEGIYENESRKTEMLAAACAVGVSCCFGAPIGGVLFSIEVTSVFFAIRNYWRGFFAAVFGSLTFRLLSCWYENQETITAIFRTSFHVDFAYDPQELLVYALIGAVGGAFGATFVYCQRRYVMFIRQSKRLNSFLQKNRFIYPCAISLLISSVYFPLGSGQFMASSLTTKQQIISLFSNFTWGSSNLTAQQEIIVGEWTNDFASFYVNLSIFIVATFFLTLVASTLPVPSGMLIPIFKAGAGFGRLVGEGMALWYPSGIQIGSYVARILPGGYAIVGAAAFSAGVTQSISICVVISEMTGQIKHIVPVMVAVLASNVVAKYFQPSLYDSIIMIKKLPYLPDIMPSSTMAYNIFVEDFMVDNVKYIWKGITFKQLRDILKEGAKIRAFPIVESPGNKMLLGSIQRWELINVLNLHIGRERRLEVAAQWQEEARFRVEDGLSYLLQGSDGPSPPPAYQTLHPPHLKPGFLQLPSRKSIPNQLTAEEPNGTSSQISPATEMANPGAPQSAPIIVVENSDSALQRTPVEEKQRRPSRFEVTLTAASDLPASNPALAAIPISPLIHPRVASILDPARSSSFTYGGGDTGNVFAFERALKPRKSILKKTTSMSTVPWPDSGTPPPLSTPATPYQTVTGNESRMRQAFENIFQRSNPSLISPDLRSFLPLGSKKVQLPRARVIDMSPEEQQLWEEAEMEKPVDLSQCHIDPAPFQLVERTSLLKVHALFSMMGVNHAYVTATGRLVGVVALPELRKAIENVNAGLLQPSEPRCPLNLNSADSSSTGGEESRPPTEGTQLLEVPISQSEEIPHIDNEENTQKLTYEFDSDTGAFTRQGEESNDT